MVQSMAPVGLSRIVFFVNGQGVSGLPMVPNTFSSAAFTGIGATEIDKRTRKTPPLSDGWYFFQKLLWVATLVVLNTSSDVGSEQFLEIPGTRKA